MKLKLSFEDFYKFWSKFGDHSLRLIYYASGSMYLDECLDVGDNTRGDFLTKLDKFDRWINVKWYMNPIRFLLNRLRIKGNYYRILQFNICGICSWTRCLSRPVFGIGNPPLPISTPNIKIKNGFVEIEL